MFCFTGMTPEQVGEITKNHSVYLTKVNMNHSHFLVGTKANDHCLGRPYLHGWSHLWECWTSGESHARRHQVNFLNSPLKICGIWLKFNRSINQWKDIVVVIINTFLWRIEFVFQTPQKGVYQGSLLSVISGETSWEKTHTFSWFYKKLGPFYKKNYFDNLYRPKSQKVRRCS